MRGQLGNLVAEALQRRDARISRYQTWLVDLHGESSLCWNDSTPCLSGSRRRLRTVVPGNRNAF
jgi:hypothetical protein